MTRACSDCATPISACSRGRCKSCAAKARYRDPAARQRMSVAKKRALADPAKRERVASAASANLRLWHATTDRDWSAWHKQRWAAVRAKAQAVEDEAARLAAMTPFERQLERVRNGARLIEVRPLPSRQYDYSLAGASPL